MQKKLHLMLVGALMLCGGRGAGAQDLLPPLGQDLELPAPADVPAAEEASYLGMTVDLLQADGKSVFVESVAEGGPAARGGLQANDVILEVNGKPISGMDDLGSAVREPPGTRLTFKVRRADGVQRLDVVTATRPAGAATAERSVDELPEPSVVAEQGTPVPGTAGGPPLVEDSRPQLGIGVTDAARLSQADKRRLGVVVDAGAVISRINEGAAAARAGLPLGGVVVSVNGQRIGSCKISLIWCEPSSPARKWKSPIGKAIGWDVRRCASAAAWSPLRPVANGAVYCARDDSARIVRSSTRWSGCWMMYCHRPPQHARKLVPLANRSCHPRLPG